MKIKIISTGGTIDKVYFDKKSDFQVGKPKIKELLKDANLDLDIEFKTLLKKDSLDLTDEDRRLIREHIESDQGRYFVVTHGTDTMVKTAKAIEGVAGKTVVLTGSMQPANFKASDAPYNIASALTAVQLLKPGVYIAMNGKIFKPDNTIKDLKLNKFVEIQP